MLRITVELLPYGREDLKECLGIAKIWNDGTGTLYKGNYKSTFSQRGRLNRIWKTCEIKDFPRQRLGIWDLLYRSLEEIVGNRNKRI